MTELLERAVKLIRSEGFSGAHSLIFLIRWANLAGDRELMKTIGNFMEEMSTMQESASLAYAYAEYYQASGAEFCPLAASFILERCSREDRMILPALAKCARVFGKQKFLEEAAEMVSGGADGPFAALGMLELYRTTFDVKYLNRAGDCAEEIRRNYGRMFRPEEAYDLEEPSVNSAVALLYDELARMTQAPFWEESRTVQNRMVSILADKYPACVAFGLCALLADAFESRTVVCAIPGTENPPEIPPEMRPLLDFYAPLTEILTVQTGKDKVKYFIMKQGKLEELTGI